MSKTIATPWGPSQQVEEIAPGIEMVSTAGHGGFRVAEELLARIPAPFRNGTPYSRRGWFEEDCDVYIVMLAFPEHFSEVRSNGKTRYQMAVEAAHRYALRPDSYLNQLVEAFGLAQPEGV